MAGKSFEGLRVYRLAEDLSDHVWTVVRRWDSLAWDTVGKQLIQSADSVGANIAEGYARGRIRIIVDSSASRADRYRSRAIGSGKRIVATC